ncbi:type IV secretory system conjugative DNA transfer family protein [Fangia hongkongensis]|uniref:type IV secretory system conjugative DNA transfer family protein n=1 Tax=Fangia hongkongensis TaxID=270495 RepID=UPI00036FFDBC|nr:type IV secretory system conjugative DNA transfer family protein [Fangia hongkongensis]MBK2124409.1 type IV secretory system conjugative DNA transfer family protein [Fangia hongkongensis]
MVAMTLAYLEALNQNTAQVAYDTKMQSLRVRALKEAAMEVGVQGGLAFTSKVINRSLDTIAPLLYQSYNFNSLMLPNNVMPAVIETGYNQSMISKNARNVTVNGQVYHIDKQSHFVSTPPTWRDYLVMNYAPPELPDKSVLPKNKAEMLLWKKYINIAWDKGIEQGVDIFKQRLYVLTRDFSGMILYYELINRNMVTLPYVSTSLKAVSANKNDLLIDSRALHLELLPEFQKNAKKWQIVLKSDKTQSGL